MYDYYNYDKDQYVNWISNFLGDFEDHERPEGMPYLSEWEATLVIMAVLSQSRQPGTPLTGWRDKGRQTVIGKGAISRC